MINLLKQLKINSSILSLEQDLKNNKDCSIFGFNFGEKTWAVNSLKKPVLFITCNKDFGDKLYSQFLSMGLNTFNAMFLPQSATFNLYSTSESLKELNLALSALQNNKLDVLIASPEILLKKFPKISSNLITFEVGKTFNFENLTTELINSGYKRVDEVETQGDFSLKGETLDICAYNEENIVRVTFFDEEVEKIKLLSIEDYSTLNTLNEFTLYKSSSFSGLNKQNIINNIEKALLIEQKKTITRKLPKTCCA